MCVFNSDVWPTASLSSSSFEGIRGTHDWIVLKTVVVVVAIYKLCIEFEQFNHVLQTLVMVLMNSLILPGPFRIEGYGGDGE